jgi:hypothetical protein
MLPPLTVRSPARLVAFTTAADNGWATGSYAALARWQRLPASGGRDTCTITDGQSTQV